MSAVIKVENVSKVYNLGAIGSNTLSDDINRMFARFTGKEDPIKKVSAGYGEDRSIHVALRDVNFEVNDGEVLGIIGKNGAGKSTLLKILSRITSPTTGDVKMKGRVASLLEVGTGFHPELTGRENIYLNGAILGMTRNEVALKFDEIVEFSGVAKFIDTPVKRYSSGMYVRLAFAVAAHLEPEILIVDEVLAVGDAEFQKKCLGKMKDVSSNQGRTVLFVSHNMTAIKNLCNRVVYLQNGTISEIGTADSVVNKYLQNYHSTELTKTWNEEGKSPGNSYINIKKVEIISSKLDESEVITVNDQIDILIEFENHVPDINLNLSLFLWNISEVCVFNAISNQIRTEKSLYKAVLTIPANLLNDDIYNVEIRFIKDIESSLFNHTAVASFEVIDTAVRGGFWHDKWVGVVRPALKFELCK